MLFWPILHSLQLSGAEAADAGFSGKKWTLSCWRRIPPNYLKIDGRYFSDGSRRHAKGQPEGGHRAPRRPPGAAPSLAAPGRAPGAPGPLPAAPFCLYTLRYPKTLKTRVFTEFRRRSMAETYREEKAISGGQIPPGRSPPGRGDRRHCHHHRHGHHRDHHQHHPQHQHHLHLHPNLISQLQLVL